MILSLGRQEERGCHHFFGMVGHGGIVKVESFEVLYCCSLMSLSEI